MVTISVPKNKLRPILRCGFLISPAIKVTLFHASLLKIEPTIDTAIAPIKTFKLIGFHPDAVSAPLAFITPLFCIAVKPVLMPEVLLHQ